MTQHGDHQKQPVGSKPHQYLGRSENGFFQGELNAVIRAGLYRLYIFFRPIDRILA